MATALYKQVPKNKNKPHVCVWTVPEAGRPKGREYREAFATPDEAWAKVFEMRRRIDSGEFKPGHYTFGEAFDRWLRFNGAKEVTKRGYRRTVKRGLGQFLDVPVQTMATMRTEVQDVVFSDWDNRHLRPIIKGTFDLAMNEGRIPGHTLGMLQGEKRPDRSTPLVPHTAEQLNRILAAMPGHQRLAVLLGRGCGLRIGESMAMETDALHDGWLEVKRGTIEGIDGLPKQRREGFTPRNVPIPHWLQPEIDAHIEAYAKDGVLFPASARGHSSKYMRPTSWDDNYLKARKHAGIGGRLTSHQLRKNWSTQLRREAPSLGVQFEDIEQWIGHSKLTWDTYAFQDPEIIQRGRNLTDPRIEK